MRHLARGLLAVTIFGTLVPAAEAATAHNSQAGSWGPTTHNCAPTPYFPANGCVSAAIRDDRRHPLDVWPYGGRHTRRLRSPGVPADPFGD